MNINMLLGVHHVVYEPEETESFVFSTIIQGRKHSLGMR